jgi:hypothetical protein
MQTTRGTGQQQIESMEHWRDLEATARRPRGDLFVAPSSLQVDSLLRLLTLTSTYNPVLLRTRKDLTCSH